MRFSPSRSHHKVGAAALAMLACAAASPSTPGDPRGVHLAAARAAAGDDLAEALVACQGARQVDAAYEAYAVREQVATIPAQSPVRVFDNLYFVGTKSVSSWALDTPRGIVIIDALNAKDVDTITSGLARLGLNPARIRFVLVTHGHADHFGGARVLQQRYGARVIMGGKDWDLVEATWRSKGGTEPPKRDITAKSSLSLGGTRIRIFSVPGHTPGNISLLLPVIDGGRRHLAAYVSGLGNPRADPAGHFRAVQRYRDAVVRAGADVLLSNHPFNDQSLPKLRALADRDAGAVHPFVIGRNIVRRLLAIELECGRASFPEH